jgi:hypothetical protein
MTAKVWSDDNERFNADSLGELIEGNDSLVVGSMVYFGDAQRVDPTKFISASDIVEMIGERAYDEAGECAEDFPNVSKEAEDELEELLIEWINKHCKATFYTVRNIEKHIITAADLGHEWNDSNSSNFSDGLGDHIAQLLINEVTKTRND